MKKKPFEKIYLQTVEKKSAIAIANCPDNWALCSFVAHIWLNNGREDFARLLLNKEETVKIRDALTKVIRDMPS